MQRSLATHLRTAATFVVKGFLPPIAFYAVFSKYGGHPAIAVAVAITVVQLAVHLVLQHVISPFFLTTALFTILFGGFDLIAQEPRYYRLAPFAENFILGVTFYVTCALKRPIAGWFVKALPPQLRPGESHSPELDGYLARVTYVWSAYFLAKSFLFLYLGLTVDLGKLIILRSVIGGPTIVLMFVGELLYRKWRKRRQGLASS